MNARLLTLLLAVLLVAGCDKIAPPGMSSDQPTAKKTTTPPVSAPAAPPASRPAAPPTTAPDDPTVASFAGLRGPKPESWEAFPLNSRMRAANYRVPGDGGDAEIVVFYFGRGQGGGVQENIERWANQFLGPEGGPVGPIVSESVVDKMDVTRVELAGGYMGMTATATPDQLFLAAIVDAPAGNVFIRFVGPAATVETHRAAFETLVNGLRRDP